VAADSDNPDDQLNDIPAQEEALLARVRQSLCDRTAAVAPRQKSPAAAPGAAGARADAELVALRDEIAEARLEDVPALVAQMERLQGVSLRRAEAQSVLVDPDSPYFGHLRLTEMVAGDHAGREPPRAIERDVFIGRATFVDPARRVNVVDWRHAPVSQLYYRYEEGSDYEERFGEREVSGEIRARRTLTIAGGRLRRIACPQGVWSRADGAGSGAAAVWERGEIRPASLAGGEGIATRPGAGDRRRGVLGAATSAGGPGTRVHRIDRHLPEIAALIDPRQFEIITAPRSGVVVIQGGAGSGKTTIGLHRIAYLAYAYPKRFPPRKMRVVTYGAALAAYIGQVLPSLGVDGVSVMTFEEWGCKALARALPALRATVADDAPAVVMRVKNHPGLLAELERRARAQRGRKDVRRPKGTRAALELWAELLTDLGALLAAAARDTEAPLPESDVVEAHRLMADRVAAVVDREPAERRRDRDEVPDDEDIRGDVGIDGQRTEGDAPAIDLQDLAMLVRIQQIRRGPKDELAHLFVDEAQDLSPAELAALIGETGGADGERSITLAGDTAQRLFLDNGFHDWRSVLRQLSLAHVAVEPLRVAYRSTAEIWALARHAMGPLAPEEPPVVPRSGAPVEAHRFPGAGAAVAFLAEALRSLAQREPRATIAILARHPEQADRYYDGLRRADVPALRRVRAQEFSFRPGIEVTDIRQTKGLEFDYVVMVDVNASSFGTDDESRHLFHIGATRAAHQLWLIVTASPSPLLPPALLVD
jgi:DNA helicase-2/ATP-dependent DNA helicase PcrA